MVDINALLQYLLEGDVLGFLQAVYVSSFQDVDLFYGVTALLFVMPLYIRTKSLMLMSIMWILLGGLFLVAMPVVSQLALLMVILGLGIVLFKVLMVVRG